ncbi:unnamed protein product [Vitrella brassicaformis CCMP3155]|uniref:Uncharacterized protein n=1 Tax=Vitrella brassicaformis (strain CCMP3155) TaxID=1169540 RepID=A0A0G4ETZ8_VITBC|nr:unnamed protein product [Vitrella brassicaformis CCMP3155]|eukprot:CEM01735.1 unnamed protein product [Vitrella brassicaformis CCMP3155]
MFCPVTVTLSILVLLVHHHPSLLATAQDSETFLKKSEEDTVVKCPLDDPSCGLVGQEWGASAGEAEGDKSSGQAWIRWASIAGAAAAVLLIALLYAWQCGFVKFGRRTFRDFDDSEPSKALDEAADNSDEISTEGGTGGLSVTETTEKSGEQSPITPSKA